MPRRNSTDSASPERGGDSRAEQRPIDFGHLSRQTMGDRKLEREVLELITSAVLDVMEMVIRTPEVQVSRMYLIVAMS